MNTVHEGSATVTLSAFLLARVAEDEERLDCGVNAHDGATGSANLVTSLTCQCDFREKRECEAKRRIVAEHTPEGHDGLTFAPGTSLDEIKARWAEHVENDAPLDCPTCVLVDVKPCPTLRALALPYAGHPDFREEWRP